jgi:tetratricopeptide (TPR) repeat protein
MDASPVKPSSKDRPPQERAPDFRSYLPDAVWRPAFLCLALGAATLMVFWPVVHCAFLTYDDPVYFTGNSHVLNGLTLDGASWAFRTGLMGNWHPVLWLSYMLDAQCFGTGPAGPHFTNLALHAANAILLFLLLDRLTGARRRSLLVAALFALHPLRIESVAWVSERKDVLSGFFALTALLAYGSYVTKSKAQSPKSKLFYGLSLLLFLLGLMSKPMLVTLPFVMLLLDCWPLQRLTTANFRTALPRLVLEKIPFLACGLIVGAITFVVHKRLGALTPLSASPISARLGNALVAYTCYLGRTFLPVNMALPYPRVEHWPPDVVALSALLIAGTCVAAIWLGRKQPYIFTGWFWFLGMLAPVSGMIRWGEHFMADRFTYLPSIGLFILLVWVIGEAAGDWRFPKWVIGAGTALILGACAVCTREQLAYWRNSETLFRHALAVTKNNYVAYCNLGMFFADQGRMEEAEGCFASAVKANPDYAPALNDLGAALLHKGLVEDAAACIQRSIQLAPADVSSHFNLGQVHVAQAKLEDAAADFETALRLDPDYVEARENLAAVLIRLGRMDEAVKHLRLALRQKPDDAEILSNLGSALAMSGESARAITCFRRAIRASPERADAHFNLANALAAQHHRDEAILEYKEALRLKPDYWQAKQQLRALGLSIPEIDAVSSRR